MNEILAIALARLSKLKRNPDPYEVAELVAAFLVTTGEPRDRFERTVERFLPKTTEAVNA